MKDISGEIIAGLSMDQKAIDPKYLYDEIGSEIFEKICLLPEYYPTRAERNILKDSSEEISSFIGEDATIIEPGSGSSSKIRLLLQELIRPLAYYPIEISKKILFDSAGEIRRLFPSLTVKPVCADFNQDFAIFMDDLPRNSRKIIFFPGSTIGNFHPSEALSFLQKCSLVIGAKGGVLVGVDLKKERKKLEMAYDDSQGVTAAFNMNLLSRLNCELGASFDVENFRHYAFYNEDEGRIEMHLKSMIDQSVKIHKTIFNFRKDETIHTESSYKYSVEEFSALCSKAKLKVRKTWMDREKLFCVYFLENI
jgi:dimethylhistidine N-methyltransferase